MPDPIQDFKDALGGDVVVPDLDRHGGLSATETLATRSWFDRRRRQLTSSGGRPTNPAWTMKRQVPLAPKTWAALKELASSWSYADRRLGPGQVAAFLLEEAVATVSYGVATIEVSAATLASPPPEELDGRFEKWHMPQPFCGSAA
jgi:hypothetical protein